MKETKLIAITVYLTCDAGLNRDNVTKGYVQNIEKMHKTEYASPDKQGVVEERVKINFITTNQSGNIASYL